MLIPLVARTSLASSCVAVLALAFGIYGAGSSLAAVVGAPKTVEIAKASDVSAQDLRAAFRRPASVPFPKDNLYTIAKAELGKKLISIPVFPRPMFCRAQPVIIPVLDGATGSRSGPGTA